jgi:carboxyl-terminal processing protease
MFPESPRPDGRGSASPSPWQWALVVSLSLLVALTSFSAGILTERNVISPGRGSSGRDVGSLGSDADFDGTAEFARLNEVQRLLEDEYYYLPTDPEELAAFREQLDRDARTGLEAGLQEEPRPDDPSSFDEYLQEREYDAIQGMTAGLEDDHTAFLEPVEQAPIAEHISGEYEGIGVWVEQPEGRFTVVSPIPGSPAEEAGLRPGDVIEAADGHPLTGTSEEDALALIRGPAGTSVRLTVRRPGVPDPLEITVERAKITVPAVSYRFLPEDRVAVVQVTVFGDKTTEQLDDALRRARQDEAVGLVLDLRNNGGGWVTGAQETIGRFVPEDRGPALYEDEEPGDGDDLRSEPILAGDVELFDLPLVVLVNGGTASASEIVAGALRDYERARLVGEPTFGKGSVQRIHDFDDGSSLRITVARWLTPDKHPIPDEGLTPDVPVPPASQDSPSADPQLDRAVEEVLDS